MYIGENIRYLRNQYGYSQEDLAKALGYKSYTTITKWESGVSEPTLKMTNQIADFFKISVNELCYTRLGVPSPDSQEQHSLNDEARKMAHFMYENPEYKDLLIEIQKAKHSDFDTLRRLVAYYCKLNTQGKEEAEKRIHELSQIGIYVDVCTQEDAIKTMNKTWAAYCDEPIAAHNDHEKEPGELEKMQKDISKLKRPE